MAIRFRKTIKVAPGLKLNLPPDDQALAIVCTRRAKADAQVAPLNRLGEPIDREPCRNIRVVAVERDR